MVSSVFAEDENAHEVSRYQLATMTDYVSKYGSDNNYDHHHHLLDQQQRPTRYGRHRSGDEPGDRRGDRQVTLGSVEDARAVIDAAVAAFPAWRDTRWPSAARSCSTSASCSMPARASWPRSSPPSTARSSRRARRGQPGQEVVEFACGIPHLLKGGFTENASTKVDVYSIRQPLGPVGIYQLHQLPGHGADVFFPIAIAAGNTVVLKPVREGPVGVAVDRRTAGRGRAAAGRVQRAAGRQDRRG